MFVLGWDCWEWVSRCHDPPGIPASTRGQTWSSASTLSFTLGATPVVALWRFMALYGAMVRLNGQNLILCNHCTYLHMYMLLIYACVILCISSGLLLRHYVFQKIEPRGTDDMRFCGSSQYGLTVCACIVKYTSMHQPIPSNSTPAANRAAENCPFLCSLSAISSLKQLKSLLCLQLRVEPFPQQLPSRFRKWEGKVDKIVDPKRPDMKNNEKQ